MNANSLSEAIQELRRQGYTEDFNLKQNCLECRNHQFQIFANEFVVDQMFRFDEMDDPGDQSVLYAISSAEKHVKGILVNGVGIYSESMTNEMASRLR